MRSIKIYRTGYKHIKMDKEKVIKMENPADLSFYKEISEKLSELRLYVRQQFAIF